MSEAPVGGRADSVGIGAALIVAAVFLMSLQDALVKLASGGMPLWQLWVLRAAIALPVLAALGLVWRKSPATFSGALGRWTMLRAALLVAMYGLLYAAIPVLDLSTIGAGFYTGPLFIAVLSAPLADEPVGLRRWLAVAAGFAGVVVMLRPGSGAFTVMALLPVASGLCYALAALVTRRRCRDAPPLALALGLNLALAAAGIAAGLALERWPPDATRVSAHPFLFGPWLAPGPAEWGLAAMLAFLIVAIGVTLAAAYQAAPPAIVAAFDYSYLAFAALWGWALFTETPDAATLAGMALIAGAGLATVRHR